MKPIRLSKVLAFLLPAVVAVTACGDDGTPAQDTGSTTDEPSTGTTGTTATTADTVDPSSTTADTVDPDTGTTSDTGPAGDACETYCTNALANCTGDNAVYPGMDECMATCAGLPEGNPTDTAGNTVW